MCLGGSIEFRCLRCALIWSGLFTVDCMCSKLSERTTCLLWWSMVVTGRVRVRVRVGVWVRGCVNRTGPVRVSWVGLFPFRLVFVCCRIGY